MDLISLQEKVEESYDAKSFFQKVPELARMMIVDGQESAKDVILCSVITPEEHVIVNRIV